MRLICGASTCKVWSLHAQNMKGVGAAYVAACSGHLGVLKELEDVSGLLKAVQWLVESVMYVGVFLYYILYS